MCTVVCVGLCELYKYMCICVLRMCMLMCVRAYACLYVFVCFCLLVFESDSSCAIACVPSRMFVYDHLRE